MFVTTGSRDWQPVTGSHGPRYRIHGVTRKRQSFAGWAKVQRSAADDPFQTYQSIGRTDTISASPRESGYAALIHATLFRALVLSAALAGAMSPGRCFGEAF